MSQGSRPLTDDEIKKLKDHFNTIPYYNNLERDKMIIYTGLYTGLRISELLSVRVKDIWDGENVSDYLCVQKGNTKGKVAGKACPLYADCKDMLKHYILYYKPRDYLFPSPQGRALCYRQALRVVKRHFKECGFTGKLTTHTMRKSFSSKLYKALQGDLVSLQQALGHKNISSTVSYVQPNREKIQDVIKNLEY
jgi:integrase